jgi:hypothetical protein
MDEKSPKFSSKKRFTPAFLVNPFATDTQNCPANIQRYLTEFEKAAFTKIFIVVLDLFQDSTGCVDKTVKMLQELTITVNGAEIIFATQLLFGGRGLPEISYDLALMPESKNEYELIRGVFNKNVDGFKRAVNNWISSTFSSLEKAGESRSILELKDFAFLESTLYVVLWRMGVQCTLHPGKLENFLACLLKGPSLINQKMLYYQLPKFSSLYCVEDVFFRRFHQGIMLTYLKTENLEQGFTYSKKRGDGSIVSVTIYPEIPD